jgi:hypothetical protein
MRKLLNIAVVIAVLICPMFAQGPSYPYQVNLNFTASTGTVTGYNMYRSPYASSACGTYAKLNATPFTSTTYVDSNPPQGAYCYAATALDNTVESGFSNIDSNILIPPPPPTGLGGSVANGNIQFNWVNHGGYADNLMCGATAPTKKITYLTPEVTTYTWTNVPSGPEKCGVYETSKDGPSALSNIVSLNVP